VVAVLAVYWLVTSSRTFPVAFEAPPDRTVPELRNSPERAEPTPPFSSGTSSSATQPILPSSDFAAPDPDSTFEEPLPSAIGPAPQVSSDETSRTIRPEPPGRLLIPIAGLRPNQLVDTYAQARAEGRRHDAIDIVAAHGTPVIAVADGTVLKLFQSEQGGITLYQLDPDQRTIYYYAHLDRYAPAIVEGMMLRRGATIGYVGDTGNAGAGNYHLHFEISTTTDPKQYWGGTPTNPYPLLGGSQSVQQQ
jgi:peptidoglycan LD-endopeptidase LytH